VIIGKDFKLRDEERAVCPELGLKNTEE